MATENAALGTDATVSYDSECELKCVLECQLRSLEYFLCPSTEDRILESAEGIYSKGIPLYCLSHYSVLRHKANSAFLQMMVPLVAV